MLKEFPLLALALAGAVVAQPSFASCDCVDGRLIEANNTLSLVALRGEIGGEFRNYLSDPNADLPGAIVQGSYQSSFYVSGEARFSDSSLLADKQVIAVDYRTGEYVAEAQTSQLDFNVKLGKPFVPAFARTG